MAWKDCPMCEGQGEVPYEHQGVSHDEPCRFCEAYSDLQKENTELQEKIELLEGIYGAS